MYLGAEKCLGAGLAADVNDLVGVGEAVELRGGAFGVRAHFLKVQPVFLQLITLRKKA